ncbi:MAG: hypothetical protein EBW05_10220, partial [Betaproteobacteria bacterium]|nr:hypothetical protein [Betaproteobacteria bacterium]
MVTDLFPTTQHPRLTSPNIRSDLTNLNHSLFRCPLTSIFRNSLTDLLSHLAQHLRRRRTSLFCNLLSPSFHKLFCTLLGCSFNRSFRPNSRRSLRWCFHRRTRTQRRIRQRVKADVASKTNKSLNPSIVERRSLPT